MITTVIPSHGLRPTLAKAVESAKESDEVFILDSIGDVKPMPGAKLVRIPDRNMVGNWNQALNIGSGEWLHLLHDDDAVLPGFYDAVRQGGDVVAVATGYENLDAQGRVTFRQGYAGILGGSECSKVAGQYLLGFLTRGNMFRPSAVVVRRDALKRIGGFRDVGASDWDCWLRLAHAGSWWFDPRPLARMLDHPDSDGSKIGAAARARAVLTTIQAAEAWLPAPFHMLAAREQFSRLALAEGCREESDKLALRRSEVSRP